MRKKYDPVRAYYYINGKKFYTDFAGPIITVLEDPIGLDFSSNSQYIKTINLYLHFDTNIIDGYFVRYNYRYLRHPPKIKTY